MMLFRLVISLPIFFIGLLIVNGGILVVKLSQMIAGKGNLGRFFND